MFLMCCPRRNQGSVNHRRNMRNVSASTKMLLRRTQPLYPETVTFSTAAVKTANNKRNGWSAVVHTNLT